MSRNDQEDRVEKGSCFVPPWKDKKIHLERLFSIDFADSEIVRSIWYIKFFLRADHQTQDVFAASASILSRHQL